jgi:hypothetical protein
MVSTVFAARSAAAQWMPLGGNLAQWAPPAVAARPSGNAQIVSVYGLDANSTNVWVNEINTANNSSTGWTTNLGGTVISRPTAVGWTNYREVFVLGTDWQIWHNKSTDNATWSGWNQLHAPTAANGLCSNPSAVSWAPGRIDVLALGCNNHLYMLTFAGSWNWADRGCCFSSDPSASTAGTGKLNISIIDSNGNLTIFSYNNGWSIARPIGGVSDPASGWWNMPNGTFASVAFGLDAQSSLVGTDNQPGFWEATNSGSITTSRVGVAYEDTFVEVYFLDQLSRVMRLGYDGRFNPTSIGLWNSGATFTSDPTVFALNGTRSMRDIYVFEINSSGNLWFARDSSQ